MRTRMCAVWLLAVTASLWGQTPAPRLPVPKTGVAGTWRAESAPPGATWTAALRVDGPRLLGAVSSCSSNRAEIEIFEGVIDGNTITFKCTSLNRLRTMTFTGTFNGDEIVFTWEKSGSGGNPTDDALFGPSAARRFTAKRVPDAADVRLAAAAERIRRSPAVTFDSILHADEDPKNWLTYSGTVLGQRHSLLGQLTPANVKELELAWLWQTQLSAHFEATPLVVDGVLYTVASNDVVALDAATGRVLWTFKYTSPMRARASSGGARPNRGLAILGDRLFLGTLDAHLIAIEAYTGKVVWNTTVADYDDPACKGGYCYVITLAPLVVKDKVIVGVGGGDGWMRGFIAAFDAATGREVWRFHTIPAPGERGNETWSGDSWKTGGVGVWQTGAYDPELNLTYWGTGNPNPAFDGKTRQGDNLYSDSVVALDADTGALKWYYQFTPHDERDWDAAHTPVLTDLEWQGRLRKVMLWANRNGFMYVFDRSTGQFLMGKPFIEKNWMAGYAFDEKGRPVRVSGTVGGEANAMPFVATNWYPPSYSPRTGLFYIPTWERRAAAPGIPQRGGSYGAVRAFDPGSGDMAWEFKVNDAVFASGVLSTTSGLVFAGTWGDPSSEPAAARLEDGYLYALDARSGQGLWKMSLAGPVHGSPMTYEADGKQYVAVAAGNTLFALALRR